MNRPTLLVLIGVLTLSAALVTSGWVSMLFVGSRSVQAQGVLGASTDGTVATAPLPYPVRTGSDRDPLIQAHHYALYNPQSGKLLLSSDAETPAPIASTTKLMTTFIVAEHGNLSDVLTISKEAASQPGSIMGLKSGERITVENVLLGTLMVSGNDGAMALAEYVGGILLGDPTAPRETRVTRLIEEMNRTATNLGMSQTHYLDPAGLNDDGHSSALDLAKLAHYALEHPTIKSIIGTAVTTVYSEGGGTRHDLRNSNRLVADYNYQGIIGGKTGFTPAAGHCLITAAERNGIKLIAVVLNTYQYTNEASAVEARKLLDWGFANWSLSQ